MDTPKHFKGKDAIGHVIEAQAQGLIASAEIHGTEVPGHISAAADAARETAIALVLLALLFPLAYASTAILVIFSIGWVIWKLGRSCWLGWARLERLHRVLAQERYEIQHHRQQERSELKELYAAKGFQGKLLEDVLDVLMADDNRLLKVMVEEELGLSLESHEHPLKQGFGAFLGALSASIVCILGWVFFSFVGILTGSLLVIVLSSYVLTQQVQNRMIPAIIWNLGIALLVFGIVYFSVQHFGNL